MLPGERFRDTPSRKRTLAGRPALSTLGSAREESVMKKAAFVIAMVLLPVLGA